jgi:hypothetical protein
MTKNGPDVKADIAAVVERDESIGLMGPMLKACDQMSTSE